MPSGPPTWFEHDRRAPGRRGRAPSARRSAGGRARRRRQAERRELGEALAECRRRTAVRRRRVGRVHAAPGSASQAVMWRMPRKRPPPARICASSTSSTARAELQIGMADDAGADLRRAIAAAGAHRRDAVDELGLADRPQLLRAGRAVHRRGTGRRRCATMLWPLPVSASRSSQQVAPVRAAPTGDGADRRSAAPARARPPGGGRASPRGPGCSAGRCCCSWRRRSPRRFRAQAYPSRHAAPAAPILPRMGWRKR